VRKSCGLLVVMGLMLVACATPTTARQGVFAVVTAYDGAVKTAVAYAGLPRCGAVGAPVVCSHATVVVQLAKANVVAMPSVNALTTVAADKTKSNSAVQVALTAAQSAVTVFSQTVTVLTATKGSVP
jgi:hypothetical protein